MITEKIILAVIGLIAFWFLLLALDSGWNKQERAECIQWNAQAAEYPLYASTKWQLEQCEAVGIPLNK